MTIYYLTGAINILIVTSLFYDYQRLILNHTYIAYLYKYKRNVFMMVITNIITLLTMLIIKETVWINILYMSYYLYHYKILGHKTVKREVYNDLIKGLYIKSDQLPKEKYDLVTNMCNGHRTDKEFSKILLTYLNTNNKHTTQTIIELFGPYGIVYDRSRAVKKHIKKQYNSKPYIYESECGLIKISREFFECLSHTNIPEVWLPLILNEFNKGYSIGQSDYRIDNLIRTINHILSINNDKLYTPKMMKLISQYVNESIEDETREEMRAYRHVKEQYLLKSYDTYLLRIKHYNPVEEQLVKVESIK